MPIYCEKTEIKVFLRVGTSSHKARGHKMSGMVWPRPHVKIRRLLIEVRGDGVDGSAKYPGSDPVEDQANLGRVPVYLPDKCGR